MLRIAKTLEDYQTIKEAVLEDKLDIRFAQLSEVLESAVKPVIREAVKSLNENAVTTLTISTSKDCQIGQNDIFALAQALASNTSLRTLDLSNNAFAEGSCKLLGKALAVNSTLKKLVLSNNDRIDHQAINALLPGLERNKTLRELIIDGTNNVSYDDVINILQSTPNLVTLHVDLFSGFLRLGHDRTATQSSLVTHGLFSLLMKNFTLTSFSIGGMHRFEFDDSIYAIIAQRNRGAVHIVSQFRGEILNMKLSDQPLSEATLKSAFSTRIKTDDFKVLYQGGFHSLTHELMDRESLTQIEANEFIRELRILSEYVYIRDVILNCVEDENTKFQLFCEKIIHSKCEHIHGFTLYLPIRMKQQSEAYYRTSTDEDYSDTRKRVIEGQCAFLEAFRLQLEREKREYEERASKYEYGYDANDEVAYSVSRWNK